MPAVHWQVSARIADGETIAFSVLGLDKILVKYAVKAA